MQVEQKRILVAEDNLALATVVRFNLEEAGFHVTLARNGREAWELLQTERFDLLVTDQQMPEMTGSEVCQRLRQDERLARIPIVMLTAKGIELDVRWLEEELGVHQVMPKPFSPRELTAAVENCVLSTTTG